MSASQLSETTGKARVFFALWPSAGVQLQLLQHGRELHRLAGGRLMRQESIHLTLAFLGDVGIERLEEVRAAGAGAAFEPFDLCVDSAGCWNHNRVAWLAPRATPAPLQALVDGLEARLQQAGLRFDARPYSPHITVIRKARSGRIDIPIAPVDWRIEDFVLVRAQLDTEGSRYSVIGRWPEP